LSYAHIFITYFLVTIIKVRKRKRKNKETKITKQKRKNKAEKNKETQKSKQKEKIVSFLSVANLSHNSPGVRFSGSRMSVYPWRI
jgi:hypothetical protein